jgi:PAS domain S-box-containing protein
MKRRFRLSSRARICLGLTSLVSTTLVLAAMLDVVQDPRNARLQGRAQLCEAIAITSSVRVTKQDLTDLRTSLTILQYRHPELLSAGVRKADGELLIEVPAGAHASQWTHIANDRSVETHVQVPILAGHERWGSVELRFQPITQPGIAGLLLSPIPKLLGFCSIVLFGVFYLYLKKMIRHVDPSQAVPGRVRSALDTLTEGLLVLDRQGRIVLANSAFSQLVGQSAASLIGRDPRDFHWLSMDEKLVQGDLPWTRAVGSSDAQTSDMIKLRLTPSDVRTFGVNCSPIMGHDGRRRGVLASFDDVTELENQRRELANSKAAAEQASAAKSHFLANMSHEIRTPMNAILGFTDVLRRGLATDAADAQRYLDTIHTSGEHLLGLINDILDLSKVESGKLEIEQTEVSAVQLVADVLTVLSVRAEEKNLRLSFAIEGRIPPSIHSDSTRLRQILTNLVGNAIKFTETGGVSIGLRHDVFDGESNLVFDVRDTGVGIPDESLARIFDPFTQADSSVTRKFGGTGLGLTISRRFAQALGGDIAVSSQLGEGSVFSVRIATGPVADRELWIDNSSAQLILQPQAPQGHSVDSLPRLKPCRILLVDDGDANRQLINLVLSRAGATVVEAVNGEEAVQRASETEFDLILMDMQMPVMDGYTATKLLRRSGFARPVVALTGNAMKGDEEKCLTAGCSAFLSKPVKIDELMRLLVTELGEADPSTADDRNLSPHPKASLAAVLRQVDAGLGGGASGSVNAGDESPGVLVSTLPMDDDDFRLIVRNFVAKLETQLDAMESAFAEERWADLGSLAHWLRGAGGTVGFPQFTEPAGRLEESLREGKLARAKLALEVLRALAARIEIPEEMAAI